MAGVIPLFVLERERKRVYKSRKLLEHLTESEIRTHCGLPWWGVREIIHEFDDLEGKNNLSIPLETKVLTFLAFLRSGSFQWTVGSAVGASQSSISRIITAATNVLVPKVNNYINFPDSQQESLDIIKGFHDIARFPGILGAIDGTQIAIRAPFENEPIYVNRKGFHSLNVQVIVDNNCVFRDVVIKWPGSTHDAFMWSNSGIKEKLYNSDIPGHLIGTRS